MINFPRSDLAVERCRETALKPEDGYKEETQTVNGIQVTRVYITGKGAAEKLEKPMGTYITVDCTGVFDDPDRLKNAVSTICTQLASLMSRRQKILAVGLGNRQLTADALGPKTVSGLLVTHHLIRYAPDLTKDLSLSDVSALFTGVLGETGIESADLVAAAVDKIKPDLVLTVDALAARNLSRLCTAVQICDTGISPGSGVGNRRHELSRHTLGVPVLSVGVPTVVHAKTMLRDILQDDEKAQGCDDTLVVTPKDIDVKVDKTAKLLAQSLNRAFHPTLSDEERALLAE